MPDSKPPALSISPSKLKEGLMQRGKTRIFLVDVREPDEYADWKIDGSQNIPIDHLITPKGLRQIPKDAEVITICAHGVRSSQAAMFLRQKGFNAMNLAGGLAAWNKVYDMAPVPLNGKDLFELLQVRRVGKGCTSYMVCYQGQCAVIDPSVHTDEYVSAARKHGFKITHVMDTHQHADHVSGARALARAVGAKLYLNPLDAYRYTDFIPLKEGDMISLGDGGVAIEAVHTPGHTKGSTSFLIQRSGVLTGDTLFVEGIARPDLRNKADEYALDLFNTYRDKILSMPEQVTILPGHFSQQVKMEFGKPFSSTLKDIRRRIPLLEASKTEFTRYVLANIPPKPSNYESIVRINKGEEPYDPEAFDDLEEGPNRCAVKV
ncbi:MAG: MBL fold metallo-hydrolase [Thaumarchaeota archaeon]|nr:MBL fold metallo-hydrolase [Nitrososphaerota archaeon]